MYSTTSVTHPDTAPAPITLRDLVRILKRRALLAGTTFAVVVAAAMVVTALMKPVYESQARVLMDNNLTSVTPSSIRDLLSSGGPSLDTEMEKIRSRAFLNEVMIKAEITDTATTEELVGRIKLSVGTGGQIMEIRARARTPEEAAKIANTVAGVYMSYVRKEIDDKIDLSLVRLKRAENRAKDGKTAAENDMYDFLKKLGVSDPIAFYTRRAARTLDIRTSLEDQNKALQVLDSRRDTLARDLKVIPQTVITGWTMNKGGLIDGYRDQIVELKATRAEKLEDFGPESFEIKEIDYKIQARENALKDLEKNPFSQGSKGVSRNPDYSAVQSALLATERERKELIKNIAVNTVELTKLEEEQKILAPQRAQYAELQRKVDATTAAYEKANLGAIDIEINRTTNLPSLRILDSALVKKTPISPKPLQNGLMAVFLGGFLGVGVALLAEYFASDPEKNREPLYALALPQVGGVPLLAQVPLAALPVPVSGREFPVPVYQSAATEDAFREIGYCLAHRDEAGKLPSRVPIVLLAGTRSDDATAALAAQLTTVLIRDGLRVTLVDADRAEPRLNQVFGKPDAPGVADVLSGKSKAKEILHLGAGGSLRFMAAGATDDPTPLTEDGLRTLFTELGQAADTDIVVVSGPSVWQARLVAPLERATDGLVLVAPDTVPPDESVARARRLLTNGYQPRILGVVVQETRKITTSVE